MYTIVSGRDFYVSFLSEESFGNRLILQIYQENAWERSHLPESKYPKRAEVTNWWNAGEDPELTYTATETGPYTVKLCSRRD